MDVKTTKTTESQGERLKKRSNVGEIWHRLRKNKLSNDLSGCFWSL